MAAYLANNIFEEIDNSDHFDFVVSNKHIVQVFVELSNKFMRGYCLKLLAHVFKKFPELWTMNFMWIRHSGRPRTHRLDGFTRGNTAEDRRLFFIERFFGN